MTPFSYHEDMCGFSRWIFGIAFLAMPGTLFAQDRVTESRDGATVTLPADEADLAKAFLDMATVWKKAFGEAKYTDALREYLTNPKAAENSQRHIAEFLGIEGGPDPAIRKDWEDVTARRDRTIASWEAWETGFTTMNFWTRAEAEAHRERDHLVFPDTIIQVRDDGAGFQIWPGFLTFPVDLDALPDPDEVAPLQLDFVLAYSPGTRPGAIARQYHDLLNPAITDGSKGAVIRSAAEIYEDMTREVMEKALARHVVSGASGAFFREGISLGFRGSLNERIDPERSRARLFGERLRSILRRQWQVPLPDLEQRIRDTTPWPADTDGYAEETTREIAMAMMFTSLKNAGPNLNSWIQEQEDPLDAEAFSERLQVATGNESWEQIFQRYCGRLADQFSAAFAPDEKSDEGEQLSGIELTWPRATAGRVEVVHPPDLAETADLAAIKVDVLLDEWNEQKPAQHAPKFNDAHLAYLHTHGLEPRARSAEEWQDLFSRLAGSGLASLRIRLWFTEDLVAELEKGNEIPGVEVNRETGDVTITTTLEMQKRLRIDSDGDSETDEGEPLSSILIPFPREEARILASEYEANVIEKQCREALETLYREIRTENTEEERFFVLASGVIGETLIRQIIASKDREWFVVGLTNWLAIQLTDEAYGEGAGQRVFAKRWPPIVNDAQRESVDLTRWTSDLTEKESGLDEAAHVYFATRAMSSALEGKDATFVKRFLDEIRKTPRKRAHLGTVYRAYKAVGGGNLKAHAQKVTKP